MSSDGRDWIEHTRDVLRAAGCRSGGARAAVIDVLGRQDCCLGVQQIHDLVRARGRPAGLASVYRSLDLLCELGLVQRLEVGGGGARYEAVRPGREHHHHAVCDDCGRVTAFEDPRLERALAALSERFDYEIDGHEVVLHGACGACTAPA